MPNPDYQSIMLPLLMLMRGGNEHSLRESIEKLAEAFILTEKERKQLLSSGQQSTFDNRVGWARSYLKNPAFPNPREEVSSALLSEGKRSLQTTLKE